jgi:hypothetical protein
VSNRIKLTLYSITPVDAGEQRRGDYRVGSKSGPHSRSIIRVPAAPWRRAPPLLPRPTAMHYAEQQMWKPVLEQIARNP